MNGFYEIDEETLAKNDLEELAKIENLENGFLICFNFNTQNFIYSNYHKEKFSSVEAKEIKAFDRFLNLKHPNLIGTIRAFLSFNLFNMFFFEENNILYVSQNKKLSNVDYYFERKYIDLDMFKRIKFKKENNQDEIFKKIVNENSKKLIFEKDYKVLNLRNEFLKLFNDSFDKINNLVFNGDYKFE